MLESPSVYLEVVKQILTMFALGTLLKDNKRKKQEVNINLGINKLETHIKTVLTM